MCFFITTKSAWYRRPNDYGCHLRKKSVLIFPTADLFSFARLSAELLSWCGCPSPNVGRTSVNSVLSETVAWDQAKLFGKLQISASFPDFFNFLVFFTLTWDPMGTNISKLYFSTISSGFKQNFMINMLIMAETYWLLKRKGNFKRYSSYSFHLISVEDICYRGGIHAVTFLDNRPSSKNYVTLWNFNLGVNGKIVKCVRSWKQLIVERNCWNIGPHGASVCTVPFMADPLSSVWGHSVHFAEFSMLRFSQSTTPTVSIQFQASVIESMMIGMGWGWGCYRLLCILIDLRNLKRKFSRWNFCGHRIIWGVVYKNGWAGAPPELKNPRPPLRAKKPKGSVSVTKWYVYSLFQDCKNYQTTGKNLVY